MSLVEGIDINLTDEKGNTVFHEACYHRDLLGVLLENGFNFEQRNYRGDTVLHITRNFEPEMIDIIDRGFNPNSLNKYGKSIMEKNTHITEQRVIDIINEIIKRGFNTNLQNSFMKQMDLFTKIALEHGFNPNKKDKDGDTIFHRSYEFKKETLQLAIEYGFDYTARNNEGQTIFYNMALEPSEINNALDMAIEYGLLTAVDNKGSTMLHQEIVNEESVWYYFNDDSDIDDKDEDIDHIEYYTTHQIKDDSVKPVLDFKKLIENGFDFKMKNDDGYTFLHINPYYAIELNNL